MDKGILKSCIGGSGVHSIIVGMKRRVGLRGVLEDIIKIASHGKNVQMVPVMVLLKVNGIHRAARGIIICKRSFWFQETGFRVVQNLDILVTPEVVLDPSNQANHSKYQSKRRHDKTSFCNRCHVISRLVFHHSVSAIFGDGTVGAFAHFWRCQYTDNSKIWDAWLCILDSLKSQWHQFGDGIVCNKILTKYLHFSFEIPTVVLRI